MIKNCLVCGKEFKVYLWLIKKGYGKFCSMDCYGKSKTGKPTWNKGMKGCGAGEKNGMWKGDNIGYRGIHYRIKTILGSPTKCEHCGKDGLTNKKIDWANKDHKYRLVKKDWIRLCKPCHRIYDYKTFK